MRANKCLSITCFLLVVFSLLVMGSCHKDSVNKNEYGDNLLMNVFHGTTVELPEGYSVSIPNSINYNSDTCILRCIARTRNNNGLDCFFSLELDKNGIWSYIPLSIGEEMRIQNAMYVKDMLYIVKSDNETTYLNGIDLKSGLEGKDIDLNKMFQKPRGEFIPIRFLSSDSDGDLFLCSSHEILVISQTYEKICSIEVNNINGMASDKEGRIHVWGILNSKSDMIMAEVNKDGSGLGKGIPLGDVQKILFAPGHDLYIISDNGIEGYDLTDNGILPDEGEEIVNFQNSDIEIMHADVVTIVSNDLFIVSEQGTETMDTSILLYRRVENIDLSSIRTVRVALSANGTVADLIRLKTVQFNKKHTETRVIIDDYTPDDRWSGEDVYKNENLLALSITTGVYKPDIVICMTNGPVFTVGANKGFFRDLSPYTENPGLIYKDNILGCIKRTYTDEKGRLFALTDRFIIEGGSVLLSTSEILGEIAEKGWWTLEEFLDFAENLSVDFMLMKNLTQINATRTLLGTEGLSTFIDIENAVCHFNDSIFTRYLSFIESLPVSSSVGERKAALASMNVYNLDSFVFFEAAFGTKDWIVIGKPTDTGYGTSIMGRAVFAILSDNDANLEVLQALMTPSKGTYESGIPAFVSELNPYFENYKNSVFYIEYEGGGSSVRDKTGEWWSGYDSNPGLETEFTDEDVTHVCDLLNNKFGVPYRSVMSEEIVAIVNEEVSAFLAGIGTAEDCANKIQSRVNIWLSEHQ